MITVKGIRQRAAQLQQLNRGLCKEIARWQGAESPLLTCERSAYLKHVQDAIAGFDAAWEALETALERIEKEAAARRGGWRKAAS